MTKAPESANPNAHINQPTENGAATDGLRLDPAEISALAAEAGFAEAGVTALPYPGEELDAQRFEEWLERGHTAEMDWLARRGESGRRLRASALVPFPWVRSAIVCLAPYHCMERSHLDRGEEVGLIARYARSSKPAPPSQRGQAVDGRLPSDYHKVLTRRLERLTAALRAHYGQFQAQACVDSHPINERALAVAAGLGWTGKNCSLIHPKLGSFTLLAVLLTSLQVGEATDHPLANRCGLCKRCLEACPTGALVAPGRLDARRCIAYLTIEHKGAIDERLMEGMRRQVFGCDLCLDACPWNRCAEQPMDVELEPRAELISPSLEWLATLTEAEYERLANGSPLRRAGYWSLLRNTAIAMGNAGLERFRPQLTAWSEAADAGLRRAARWALDKLGQK